MAHLLRGKQAGISNDLSAGLGPDLFVLDHIRNYGINSQISQIAYDPVQSLLALGTNESKYGPGQIYIFGQKRVQVVLPLPHRASVKILQFCAEKLLCLDSRNDLQVYSLESKKLLNAHALPAKITALHSDPTLDYALLGTQTGEVLAYDLDRERLAPFKIPNLWREQYPRARPAPVVTLSFHPRDIGNLLIGYQTGAVIYSFKQNKAVKFFDYVVPKGAPGGDSDPALIPRDHHPLLTQALWHPTGTFILTGHEDTSIVIWDPKDGRVIEARTLQDTNVDKPGPGLMSPPGAAGTVGVKSPLFRIAWCANQDPDDTGILIAGGAPSTMATKALTFFELGRTPVYNTSTWQALQDHFENPKRQRILPTPPATEVVDFCLIPRSTPHFAGAQDPLAIIGLLDTGELITLSFPSGMPICPTNQLHLSMTLVHPFINHIDLSPVERTRWLGLTERRTHGPLFITGGHEANYPLKRFENRNIVQTSHNDGTVRLWDAGHGDEIENDALIQLDVGRAVGRQGGVEVSKTSFAGAAGELSVGLKTGEVAVFRWGVNKHPGQELPLSENRHQALTDITDRAEAALKEGMIPLTLLDQGNGPVTALKHSDVGFIAAGFEGGSLAVIDLRGPAIIYTASISDFAKADKRGSFRRSSTAPGSAGKPVFATSIEFSIMTADGDDYSSILLHVGTNLGHLATLKIAPEAGTGRYGVSLAGVVALDDRIINICPIHTTSGKPAYASQASFAGLRTGFKVNGVLVVVTASGVRIFQPPTQKGAAKTWNEYLCDAAAIVRYEDVGHALLGLFGDGYARAFSIPALKEIGAVKVSDVLDVSQFSSAVITGTGDILGWKGPAEMVLVNVFGVGKRLEDGGNRDVLLNPALVVPPRPTISNLQWISGTQMVGVADMDLLIGGPDRPPSKRAQAQARADQMHHNRSSSNPSSSNPSHPSYPTSPPADEGWGAWASRQLNERTEKLNIVGDSMEGLQRNSAGWAEDVNKFVGKQKRGLVMGAVKSKFGF